jgi:hypothetical protein
MRATNGTSSLHLLLAWGLVGLPLIWGVYKTLSAALALFQ